FRTAFKTLGGETNQVICRDVLTPFESHDFSKMAVSEKEQRKEQLRARVMGTPFDLRRVPLFRTALIKLDAAHYQLIFCMHHIISDGWSLEILKREFDRLYSEGRQGREVDLPLPELHYRDFSVWHNSQMLGETGRASHSYWKEKLAAGIPALQLPADRPPDREDNSGAAYRCGIGSDLTALLKKMAETHNTTLFAVIFSLYLLFLYRVSGQRDVSCSIISAGRDHPSLQDIIGFFVNSLIFTTRVEKQRSFVDFLGLVNRDVIEILRHQTYPIEPVCKELGIRFPDIPASINMVNLGDTAFSGQLEPFDSYHIEQAQDVKFDIEVYITEYRDGIDMYWAYKKNMFEPATIAHMVDLYIELAQFATGNPGGMLEEYFSEGETHKPGRFKKKKKKRR
ncbi:MAG: hypothetical protein KAW12_02745, partial [Candidatus Aminicenantes bacterium]|nr:hypothetical protein [Candidatus Aminicenantes bacterium]